MISFNSSSDLVALNGTIDYNICFLHYSFAGAHQTFSQLHINGDKFYNHYKIFAIIILPFVFLAACGNFLILLSIAKTAVRSNPFHVVIFSQFLADLLLSGFIYPTNLIAVILDFYAPKELASTFGFLFIVALTSNATSICAVAVERVRGIVFRHGRTMERQIIWARFGAFLSWILPMAVTLPVALNIVPGIVMCSEEHKLYRMGTYGRSGPGMSFLYVRYLLFTEISFVIIPSIIIVACYAKIFIFMKNRSRAIQINAGNGEGASNPHNTGMQPILLRRVNNAKMAFLTAVTFVLTYYPYIVMTAYRPDAPVTTSEFSFRIGTTVLLWSGCCINPIIYSLLSWDFKQWFIKHFCR